MNVAHKKIVLGLLIVIIALTLNSCSSQSKRNGNNSNNDNDNIDNFVPTFTITNDWGREAIGYEIFDSSNLRIAVIDSANYYEATNVTNHSVCHLEQTDTDYHGSFIVSLLCSLLPNADIVSINVADENGNISSDALAEGIIYAKEQGCRIINVSLGTQKNYPEIEFAVSEAVKQGCIFIAASGNESLSNIDFPARYENVISVMSRDIDNIDDATNNVNISKKSFSAPGSIVFNDCYIFSGSSISTVYVTAEVAYIISQMPNLAYSEVYNILKQSSVFATDYSHGMVNHRLVTMQLTK